MSLASSSANMGYTDLGTNSLGFVNDNALFQYRYQSGEKEEGTIFANKPSFFCWCLLIEKKNQ